jgi:ring-1,2-phenylacetyl-CoA epoxidase subunit PaaD
MQNGKMNTILTSDQIMQILTEVKDPEIPVLNVVDMGIVRGVEWKGDLLEVTITPTYSGCPAMDVISANIKTILHKHFGDNVKVLSTLFPPWTTDWLTDDAREKLRAYGIAPPEKGSSDKSLLFAEPKTIACPKCGAQETTKVSEFGSTSCKAHYKCDVCLEPFDYFKCI